MTVICDVGNVVTVVIELLETEEDFDYVKVYYGVDMDEAESLSGMLSGDMEAVKQGHEFVSSGPSLAVDFKSDESVGAGGFEVSYTCGHR